jgi:hypothetical protein
MRSQVCQNIDIRLTRREDSATEAASPFQGDLMTKLWSSGGFMGHFGVLWILR